MPDLVGSGWFRHCSVIARHHAQDVMDRNEVATIDSLFESIVGFSMGSINSRLLPKTQ
jgi:hypothetical protein